MPAVTPPPPSPPVGKATLTASASPSSKSVKVGKSATFSVTVRNTGNAAAAGAKVCASVSSRVTLKKKCVTIGALAAGTSKKVSFSAKPTKKAKGHAYKVTFKATATGVASKTAGATVKVR